MSPDVLNEYIGSRAWEGKAGAYGIQDHDDAFIERIEGSFSNVVGLPMELLADTLIQMGYSELVAQARIQAHANT
jgi:septum formation protein